MRILPLSKKDGAEVPEWIGELIDCSRARLSRRALITGSLMQKAAWSAPRREVLRWPFNFTGSRAGDSMVRWLS
jgi:hypothetical protein